ncbi:MAG: hypothetical protein ATN31_10660 [Candidatus Epulonipiscioides saccharophilum]|nr:MAG: hypothetical protein ATN31_10660 [Epulopiscium sp. AS2M-Bin001]
MKYPIVRKIFSDLSNQYTDLKEQYEINKLVNEEIYPQVSLMRKYILLPLSVVLIFSCFIAPKLLVLIIPILIGASIIKKDLKVKKRKEITERYRSGLPPSTKAATSLKDGGYEYSEWWN